MSFETAVRQLPRLVHHWVFEVDPVFIDSLLYYRELWAFMPLYEVGRSFPTLQDLFAWHVGRMSHCRMLFEKLLPGTMIPRKAVSLGYGGLWLLYARRARHLFEERWVGAMICAGARFCNEHNLGATGQRQCRDARGGCLLAYELMHPRLWSEFYVRLGNECSKEDKAPSTWSIAAIAKRVLDRWLFSCERGRE